MSNTIYAALARQTGLMKEMQTVANNIANSATTGFRTENVIFSEFIQKLGPGQPSLSMGAAEARFTSATQGVLEQTNGTFDLAIEGEGYFQIETPAGLRLTRAGAFTPGPEGELVTFEGYRLLDAGGAPVFIPADAASIAVSSDGTLSADGTPLGQIGLVMPAEPSDLAREDGVRFRVEGELIEPENSSILQGYLEGSNVDPISEIARMIEVQRSYEMGQSFLEEEDKRLRSISQLIQK